MAHEKARLARCGGAGLRYALLAGVVVLGLPSCAQAKASGGLLAQSHAQVPETRRFAVPAQPLPDALPQFSEQAGIQISAPSDLVRGIRTPGISGNMTVSEALDRLLSGSGLDYRITTDGALIYKAPEDVGDGAMLGTILVEAPGSGDKFFGAADRAGSLYIGKEDLERRNPTTMRQVFAGESAVSVGGAIPVSQKVYVNSIEETNLAVTLDGSPQNNTVFHHNGNNLIDPSLLKAVRVEAGVASADAGPGALGGSITYETVDVDDVLAPDRSLGGFGTSSFNTNGDVFINGISIYGRAAGFEALGYVKHGTGDDYEDGSGDRVYGTETDFYSYLAKGAYESDSGHRFEISAQEMRDDADRPFRANIGQIPGRPDPLVREYDLRSRNYVLSYSMARPQGPLDPELLIAYSDTKIGVPKPYDSEGTTGGFSSKLENDFAFGEANSLTLGTDFYHRTARYKDPTVDMEEEATNLARISHTRKVHRGSV